MPYLAALGLTLLVEVPIYAALLAHIGRSTAIGRSIAFGRSRALRRSVLAGAAGVGVNLVTHPVVWHLAATGVPVGRWLAIELGAWVVEFGLLWAFFRRRSPWALLAAAACLANSLSALAGVLAP